MTRTMLNICLLLMISFYSCSDLFEKEVDDYPIPFEVQLVVTAFLMPQDSLIMVEVRKTYPVDADITGLQQQGTTSIENAIVIIRTNTSEVEMPYDNRIRKYVLHQDDFPIESNGIYFISVTTPDGLSAESVCQIPAASVEEDSINGSLNIVDDGGVREYFFYVSFPKATDSISYYAILKQEYRMTNDSVSSISSQEQLEVIKSSDLIGDYITSSTFPITPSFAGENYHTEVYVCRTDSSYFQYHQDLNDYFINTQNPFTEEFNIYTNIDNGRGVFAGLNCTIIRL